MATLEANSLGYEAYDDTKRLTDNPFHFDEEHAEWEAWRTGWINAEADARKAASAYDDQS